MNLLMGITQSSMKAYRVATNRMRLMPDFLIIGTQRGGTTSLYNYLNECPRIAPATLKEVHFFDTNFQKGVAWYRAQFPLSLKKYPGGDRNKQALITGEASPYYLFHPHAPARVAQVVPSVKLIALLRNPVERAYSHYCFEVEMGHEKLSFEEALAQEEARTQEESARIIVDERYHSYNHQHYTYLARGIYADQLERWLKVFPKEQLLVIKSEDFYGDPTASIQQVLKFLDIRTISRKRQRPYQQYNASGYTQPAIDQRLRKELVAYFKPHNKRLYQLINRDFGWH